MLATNFETIFSNAMNSPFFWLILIIWIGACIADFTNLKKLGDRLVDLGNKPIIFRQDQKPDSVPFYFRENLETASNASKDFLITLPDSLQSFSKQGLSFTKDRVYNTSRPHRILGYSFAFLLFLFFVWADSVGIVGALDAFGIISFDIPIFLRYYEVAAAVGSLFAVLVGLEITKEISAVESMYTDWDEKTDKEKKLPKALSILLSTLGFITVLFIFSFR